MYEPFLVIRRNTMSVAHDTTGTGRMVDPSVCYIKVTAAAAVAAAVAARHTL